MKSQFSILATALPFLVGRDSSMAILPSILAICHIVRSLSRQRSASDPSSIQAAYRVARLDHLCLELRKCLPAPVALALHARLLNAGSCYYGWQLYKEKVLSVTILTPPTADLGVEPTQEHLYASAICVIAFGPHFPMICCACYVANRF